GPGAPQDFRFGVVIGPAELNQLRTRASQRGDFGCRGRLRYYHKSRNPQQRRRARYAQSVVAGRGRDHTRRPLEELQRVQRSPQLERSRELETLVLEPDVQAAPL